MHLKTLLTKSLLVAAGLCVGSSVWADVPTYTWDFTNTTTWTTAKVSTGSAVTLNPSGETPGTGEYGVTFNLTYETGGFVGWKYYNSNSGSTGFWFTENGNATTNTVSVTVPNGFKVTFNLVVGSSTRPFGYTTDGGLTTRTTNTTPYQYTNDTGSDVTISMWATNGINGARYMNCISNIIMEDFSSVASHTWSAKAYATINEVKTEIGSWNAGGAEYSESESYYVWAKKVISYGGHYYELDDAKFAANAVYFSTTMGDADGEHEITYTLNDDIAFYTECEDWYDTQNTNSLIASGGVYVNYYNGTHNVSITNAGIYKMETNVLSRGAESGLRVYDSEDNELAGFYRAGTGFKQTDAFFTGASSTIKVGLLSANTAGIDYVLIRKITEVTDAITYCKTCENSSDFATYIDGLFAAGSLLTTAQVYAAYNAWEVAQAVASSSTNYTKVILNADFDTNNLTPWAIYGDAASAGSDADSYGVLESNGNGGYQYYTGYNGRNVSQTITGLPAGVYTLKARIYSWSGGAPVKIFANGIVSAEEGGENHEMSLDFVVTGSEENIKIGVGGVGNGSGDNTWGTWGYRIDYFTLTKVESISATITSSGFGTIASAYALDCSALPSGVKAYKVSELSASAATLEEVTTAVAANTGLILNGTAGTYSIPVAATGSDISATNYLKAAATATDIAAKAAYILQDGLFHLVTAASTVPAGKAYLLAEDVPAGARDLKFAFGDEATGISSMHNSECIMHNEIFNLAGQRVVQPTKGLYIVNGKKVIVK